MSGSGGFADEPTLDTGGSARERLTPCTRCNGSGSEPVTDPDEAAGLVLVARADVQKMLSAKPSYWQATLPSMRQVRDRLADAAGVPADASEPGESEAWAAARDRITEGNERVREALVSAADALDAHATDLLAHSQDGLVERLTSPMAAECFRGAARMVRERAGLDAGEPGAPSAGEETAGSDQAATDALSDVDEVALCGCRPGYICEDCRPRSPR